MNADYTFAPILLVLFALLVSVLVVVQLRQQRDRLTTRAKDLGMRVGLISFAALLSVVAVSSAYNAFRVHSFWSKHPPLGPRFNVDGNLMYIHCTGSGAPTVILDAGLGDEAIHWATVQEILSKKNRVCSYDRAGFGWSDTSNSQRDADHIAKELHELLADANIHGPLVLTGHSLAGLYIRKYATLYPAEVAGLVFVDATTPLQEQDPVYKRTSTRPPPEWLLHLGMIAGVPRLIHMCSPRIPDPSDIQRMRSEAYCRLHYGSLAREADNVTLSGRETAGTGPYDVPILILSHDPNTVLGAHPRADEIDRQQVWSRMQEELKALSPHSRRIILRGTTHSLISQRPDAVAGAITDLLTDMSHNNKSLDSNALTVTR